jgi:predicted dehydrogenase
MKYRWGILGTGAIAHKFAADLADIPKAILHSVHSRTYDKAQKFAKKYGFENNHRELSSFLGDPDLDIVYIATPNHLHCEQTIQCLDAGKHVLVEKPMALNVREVKLIARAAEDSGRFCMEAMWSRFMPVYQEVKKLLKEDAIGDVKLCSAELGHPIAYHPDRFRFDPGKGGGSLMDVGVYPISLTLMLLGQPERVEGVCRKGESGVDTTERLSFYYENGAFADIRASFDCRLSNGIWIAGDKGAIEIPGPIYRPDRYYLENYTPSKKEEGDLKLKSTLSSMAKSVKESITNPFTSSRKMTKVPFEGNGYTHEAVEVMNAIYRGETQSRIMSLEDSSSVLEITDQLRKDWDVVFPGIDN